MPIPLPPGMPAQPASTAAATEVVKSERILAWRMVGFLERQKDKNKNRVRKKGCKTAQRAAMGRHHTPALRQPCHGG